MKKTIIILFCLLSVSAFCNSKKKGDKHHSSNMCYNLYGKTYGKHNQYVKVADSDSSKNEEDESEDSYEAQLQKFTGSNGIQNIDLENDYKNFNNNSNNTNDNNNDDNDEDYLREQYSPFSIKNYPPLQLSLIHI